MGFAQILSQRWEREEKKKKASPTTYSVISFSSTHIPMVPGRKAMLSSLEVL